ncbi:MAG TPA: response regulator [Thermodesulfobacteriota bacterium]|nr:response regulator [Thermodesulfobacteriota bacterium]
MADSNKSKVLMIEDDPVLQRMYISKLTEGGYEVDLARDGAEGLHKALNTDPDLVLLDLMLPKVDGLQILAEMRKNPKTRKTPVIVLSNLAQADDATKALQLGADDYVVKLNTPPSSVLKKVQMLLSQRKARDAIYTSRYHIKIDTTQADAPQLVRDFGLIFFCAHCRTQQILELMPDYNSTGSGHRFVAQFVCPICKSVY